MVESAPLSQSDWEAYTSDRATAGAFENQILYAMCRDHGTHDDPYVTAGKVIAIGRIYAASPARGAGNGREAEPLASGIGQRLKDSKLDCQLEAIDFPTRFSGEIRQQVVEVHKLLVDAVAWATKKWSEKGDDDTWSPRNQASFASKYLHFHRPNAFPIMDSYAKAGLKCAGVKGVFYSYERFCAGFAEYCEGEKGAWTPRSLDTRLVARGRAHLSRSETHCPECKAARRLRKAKSKTASDG